MKKIAITTLAVITLVLAAILLYRISTIDDRNAFVAEEIRKNPDSPRALRAMLIYLADGRMYPVNYLKEES